MTTDGGLKLIKKRPFSVHLNVSLFYKCIHAVVRGKAIHVSLAALKKPRVVKIDPEPSV